MDNHEETSVLTENSSSEGLQLVEWTKSYEKNILKEDKPDSVLIHIDTNDVNNHKLYAISPEKLASDIIEIGRSCKSFNVKEEFKSSVLCRNDVILSNQINRTNELLNKLCKENDFNYISNSNITPSHYSKDGIRLNDIGLSS